MTFTNPSRRSTPPPGPPGPLSPLPSRSSDHRPGRGGPSFTVISTIRSEDELLAALRKPHVFYAPKERRSLWDVVRSVWDVVRGWLR